MPKFKFQTNLVVEAATEEEALSRISGRIKAIIRHLGNGVPLADSEPFFTLTPTATGTPVDLSRDPVVQARRAAESAEESAEEDPPAEPEGNVGA